jgi:peptidoglycan/LPS O-acetylase OafA/YrhL
MHFETAYRKDIDGLRCLAVVPVVAFHAFPHLLTGGFVGVDVFFVISGFLISGQIQNELRAKRFSISGFYARRVRRIFPALTIVLLSTLALGWALLLPSEFAQLIKHVIGGATFSSNFVLWNEVGYFDKASELKPLLHLWSLGVEEQFYILWPIILMAVYRLNWPAGLTILIVAGLSFGSSLWWIRHDPSGAFFLPFPRFWELLLGALLAELPERVRARPILRDLGSFAGLAAILVATVALSQDSHYPGLRAVLPTLGAAVLIASGTQALVNKHLLSSRLFVAIGKISYPLYLWHWPLLSFLDITNAGSAPIRLCVVAVSIVLAGLTWRLIERPIRAQPSPRFAPQLAVALTGVLLLALASLRIDTLSVALNLTAPDAYEWPASMNATKECRAKYGLPDYPEPFCVESRPDLPPSVMIIGDSNANHWMPGLAQAYLNLNVINIGGGGCLPIEGVESFSPLDDQAHQRLCHIAIDRAFEILQSTKSISLVILSARLTHHFPGSPYGSLISDATRFLKSDRDGASNEDVFRVAAERTFESIRSRRIKAIVVLQIPELGFDPMTCAKLRPTDLLKSLDDCTVPRRAVESRQANARALMFSTLKGFSEIAIYDPFDELCDGRVCRAQIGHVAVYRDQDHLSREGSIEVWKRLAETSQKRLDAVQSVGRSTR